MLVPGRSDEAALAALRLPQPRNASAKVSPRPLRGTGTHRRPRGATLGEGLTNGTRRPVELNVTGRSDEAAPPPGDPSPLANFGGALLGGAMLA